MTLILFDIYIVNQFNLNLINNKIEIFYMVSWM